MVGGGACVEDFIGLNPSSVLQEASATDRVGPSSLISCMQHHVGKRILDLLKPVFWGRFKCILFSVQVFPI